jgi:NADH-quinone oxidoreductase subunit F
LDLRIPKVLSTAEERSALDAVLGPVASPEVEGRVARAAPQCRDLLLPALHAVQDRVGWISEGALFEICRRLDIPPAEAFGVASFYHLFSLKSRAPEVLYVCDDIACRTRGAESLCEALTKALGPAGQPRADQSRTWLRSPCLGQCERAPAVLARIAGAKPVDDTVAPVADANELLGEIRDRHDVRRSVPQAGSPGLRLLARIGVCDAGSLDDYRRHGGYAGLTRAIEMGPEAVIREVVASKLVGRGGAAFPTGRKWGAVARAAIRPHYLVCNADESEPGTFKDRILMEEDPFAVLEGMTIGAFATGCERGFIYVRGEYPLAARRLGRAIEVARAAGLLGSNILGRGFAFDIEIRRGAGAYICGEETALFNSIEGRRGEPRSKPPFPVEVGLFGKPTVVNNVETLVNVPHIMLLAGAAFANVGTAGSTGTKLLCVSGQVARPGLYEVPFGTTLRQVIEMAGASSIGAVLLGGAAGTFVGPSELNVRLTFEDLKATGATLGSGVVMVFHQTADLGDILRRIAAFFRDESCGQCVPCRVGTVRQEELLDRLASGRPLGSTEQDLALFHEISQAMRDASICGLGQTASSAIESALVRFDPFAARRTTP